MSTRIMMYTHWWIDWKPIDVVVLIGGLTFLLWTIWIRSTKIVLPFPPGPKGYPIIGNMFNMPTKQEWFTYTEWGKTYGPITYVEAGGLPMIILNSYDIACELLDKRSNIYSDRRTPHMKNERMGWGWLTPTIPYGDRLRKHRAIMHKYLQPSVVKNYTHTQNVFTYRMLGHILETPNKFMQHIRSSTGSSIMMLTYGYEAAPENDKFITLADEALQWLSEAGVPGTYLVDFIPLLKYVPHWFPGTQWKIDGRTAYHDTQAMLRVPFEYAKERIAKGTAVPSLLSDSLEGSTSKEEEELIAEVMATAYVGGADTSVSVLQSTILAMALYPEVLKRAQDELDDVVGESRLPSFEDREHLPYIEGTIKEALRWNPVFPIGVPHRTSAEDEYGGYRIPDQCTVIPNQWGMFHNEQMYPDPFAFKPERWLDNKGMLLKDSDGPVNPNKIAFGFGRRICPGRYYADNTLFISLACLLSVFDFNKAKDAYGNVITPVANYSSGTISHPKPFKCSITPRSDQAVSLIKHAVESARL